MKLLSLLVFLALASCAARPSRNDSSKKNVPRGAVTTRTQSPKAATATTAPAAAPSEWKRAVDLERSGHFLDAFMDFAALDRDGQTAEVRQKSRERGLDLIETRLSEGELKKISDDSSLGVWRGQALYQLGRIAKARQESEDARKYFNSVVSFLPGSDLAFQAETEIATLDRYRQVEPRTIGAVLPLSGRNAVVGQKNLRGIQMGLSLQDPNSPFRLAVIDSAGNPDQARRAVERLVREDNVMAIIGGVLSRTAPAEAAKAQELDIPFIALSQRSGLTDVGPSVFRNALTSEMLVRELVKTSMNDLGLKRFAILYPNDAYGVEYANAFWDEVAARGGKITAVQTYDPNETDFRAVAQRLVGTWYLEAREDEFKLLLREQAADKSRPKKSVRQESNADDVLPPRVDFDAVFIPDSSKLMTQMTAFLSFVGVRGVKVLGTNLWGAPGLAKKAGLFGDHLLYVDQRLPDQDPSKDPRFYREYRELFNETPGLFEVQAFDSALLVRSLVMQGASSREELVRRLAQLQGFPGALGPLSMNSRREVKRPLMSITYSRGNPTVLRRSR